MLLSIATHFMYSTIWSFCFPGELGFGETRRGNTNALITTTSMNNKSSQQPHAFFRVHETLMIKLLHCKLGNISEYAYS
jgi:hypothetical protein